MRKFIGNTWLTLAGVLLLTQLTRVKTLAIEVPGAGGVAVFSVAFAVLIWPLSLLALAYLSAPRPLRPPKSALELSDRTWFAKMMLGAAMVLFVVKLVLVLA
jgi:hypothetical protein